MSRVVDWPTKGLLVERDDKGWGAYFPESSLPTPLPSSGNLLIRGNLDSVLHSLEAASRRFSAVCIDFPHLSTLEGAAAFGPTSIAMSVCEATLSRLPNLVSDDSSIIILAECWTAPWVLAAIESQSTLRLRRLTCWQKRYSGLQDKRGVIDSSFDLIFELGLGNPSEVKYELLPDELGLRSEDATKHEEQLKDEGVYGPGVGPSKRAKPERLCELLVNRSPAGAILELMTDSGYFSAAAIRAGREFVSVVDTSSQDCTAAWTRLVARLGSVSKPIEVRSSARVPVADSALRKFELTTSIQNRAREFGIEGFPHYLRISADSDESVVGVSTADPFIGLRRLLSKGAAASILNVNGQIADPEQLVADWFEAAGLQATCAVRSDLVQCLRLASWAVVRLGRDSQVGLITSCAQEAPFWWLLLAPTPHDRRYALQRDEKYSNPTRDPRGPYRDIVFKGARSGSEETRRAYNIPPYRFSVVSGSLPPGFCRVDEVSGVMYAPKLLEAGEYECVIRVTDSAGAVADGPIRIQVSNESGGTTPCDTDVWWLDSPLSSSQGRLRAQFPERVIAVVGRSCSFVLRATGGSPYRGVLTPSDRSGERQDRYWPWGRKELVARLLQQRVGFGKHGDAKFQNRVFESEREVDRVTVHSWWGARSLEKWGAKSDVDALCKLLRPGSVVLLSDGKETPSGGGYLRIHYESSAPATARLRVRGVPYPLWNEGWTIERLMRLLGYLELAVPAELCQIVQWFGTSVSRREIVAVLANDISPTASVLNRIRQTMARPAPEPLLVLYFCGKPSTTEGVRFARIPFEVDRC